MQKMFSEIAGLLALIIGVAILAVLVSRQANTSQVIQSSGQAFSNLILAAVSPVTGGGSSLNMRGGSLGSSLF